MISVGLNDLTLSDVWRIAYEGAEVTLADEARLRMTRSADLLEKAAEGGIVYGVNTGFGPMAAYAIAPEERTTLQLNLIRSHAMGMGTPLAREVVRLVLLGRMNTLAQGASGVPAELGDLLAAFLNNNILPVVPEHGGVGASGDLVQLAHVALSLIGEGEVFFEGERVPTAVALEKCGLKPCVPKLREGLALINGTSAMTGIGLDALLRARSLFGWALRGSALLQEVVEAYSDTLAANLHTLKKHPGQSKAAELLRAELEGSSLIRKRDAANPAPENGSGDRRIPQKVQDVYSVRCQAQILGPILDEIERAEQTLLAELHSVDDNPAVDLDTGEILHGGNFHGEYVAQAMDKLKLSIIKLTMLAERQLNLLLDDRINGSLPPFLNQGELGINLGLQGMQFTATSTTAESQSLATPVSLHSIPCNKENQDVVSMGANAALMARKVVENGSQVTAILWAALSRAVHLQRNESKLGQSTAEALAEIQKAIPEYASEQDCSMAGSLERVAEMICQPNAALF